MELLTITATDFNLLSERLEQIEKRLVKAENGMQERWIDNQEFMQLLKVSRRCAQNYRDKNMIGYSIIGNRCFYKLSEVEKLLERHYNKCVP